jgi:hypothetical protein
MLLIIVLLNFYTSSDELNFAGIDLERIIEGEFTRMKEKNME